MPILKSVGRIAVLCLFFLFLISPLGVFAETGKNLESVHMFTNPTCAHCTGAKKFFEDLKKENNLVLEIHDFTLSQNADKAKEYYEKYSVPKKEQGLVPAIFIGNKYYIGFNEEIGEEIAASFLGQNKEEKNKDKEPFLSEANLSKFSLPILAVILGIVDGFNVCSLGALLLILGLVIILGSRKRILLFGGAYILTTALIYGLMILLWHQLFSFIAPYVKSMEMLVGVLALVGGIYLLREFYKARKSGPICSSNNIMSRLSPKMEKVFRNKTNWLLLLGSVVAFSAAVTIIEFPCSAFLPVLFTSILVDSGASFGVSVLYMLIYMLFYMLDETVVFLIAAFTLKIKIASSPKFITFFNLLAALIFIFIGTYYLLAPLIFG